LTGAEAACVVNNCAAALVLTLAVYAHDREVVVSRGELIEIGGGFRLPEIMAASGARLLEVGATNRTRIEDYERAITNSTAMLLKVHPSNFRIRGFDESPTNDALSVVARRHNLPLVYDIGSGALGGQHRELMPDEPVASDALAAGADLVMFSGDKLVGGPQAGIIVGRKEAVRRLCTHPLMRAFRVDKLTLAALGATLQLHIDPSRFDELPVARMTGVDPVQLRGRADAIVAELKRQAVGEELSTVETEAYIGGGAVPQQGLPSYAVRIGSTIVAESELARRLRLGEPPVFGRLSQGAVLLDLRTVAPTEDETLTQAVVAALGGNSTNAA
jgi:L-seryl-tRNA(Ser) seleniumtransferase